MLCRTVLIIALPLHGSAERSRCHAGLRAVLESPDASNTTIQEYVDAHQTTANIAGQALTLVSGGITSYEEFERVTLNI